MSVKTKWVVTIPALTLRFLYHYAKLLGMVYFSITDQNRLKCATKTQFYSIAYRLFCLVAYTFFLPSIYKTIQEVAQLHLQAMAFIELMSIVLFTVVFLLFQIICHKQFVSVVNGAMNLFIRIIQLTGNSQIFGREFYFVFAERTTTNALTIFLDSSRLVSGVLEMDLPIVLQCLLGYCLWFGTLLMVDIICLGYITASGLYSNLGQHMRTFARRIETSETITMTKFRRMQVLCEFTDELEICSDLYSRIFKVTREFHELFQFNILLTFYVNLIMVICNIHYNFLSYVMTGQMMWSFMFLGITRVVDLVFLVLVMDSTVRRSEVSKSLNWDSLCSDTDDRWDMAVDHFLNQMKLEDLKMDVYGFFQLNNALCLRIISAVVTYMTILAQFFMLGYFK